MVSHVRAVHAFAHRIEQSSSFGEWLRWFFLMLGLCLGVAIAATFGFVDVAIYATMAALIAVAFYSSYRDVASLHREVSIASRQMQQLVDLDDIEEFLDQTEKAGDHSLLRSHIQDRKSVV